MDTRPTIYIYTEKSDKTINTVYSLDTLSLISVSIYTPTGLAKDEIRNIIKRLNVSYPVNVMVVSDRQMEESYKLEDPNCNTERFIQKQKDDSCNRTQKFTALSQMLDGKIEELKDLRSGQSNASMYNHLINRKLEELSQLKNQYQTNKNPFSDLTTNILECVSSADKLLEICKKENSDQNTKSFFISFNKDLDALDKRKENSSVSDISVDALQVEKDIQKIKNYMITHPNNIPDLSKDTEKGVKKFKNYVSNIISIGRYSDREIQKIKNRIYFEKNYKSQFVRPTE